MKRLFGWLMGWSVAGLVGCSGAPAHPETTARSAAELSGSPNPPRLAHAPGTDSAAPALVLTALTEELERSARALARGAGPPAYHIAYEAIEEHSFTVGATLGAIESAGRETWRALDVDVRVGSPAFDNRHPLRDSWDPTQIYTRSAWLPIEDNELAIRTIAWLTTHQEYQRASEELVVALANRQVKVKAEDDSPDFSPAPPLEYLEPLATLEVDEDAWTERIRALSSRFRTHATLTESGIELDAHVEHRYQTTSDGARIQLSRPWARVTAFAQAVADDGMELGRYEIVEGSTVATLHEPELERAVERVIADVEALRTAPVIEPYTGPAILDGRAAGVFFHEVFGHRIEGHRQKNEDEGQTFAKKIGARIMPRLLTVYDDPTVRTLNGVELAGYYPVDDEGVRGRRVPLVEDGVLRGFLLSRSPIRGFAESNGHGRRQRGHRTVSRQGNLIVAPARSVTPGQLKERLLEEVRRQGKRFGLRFSEITGGYTNTSRAEAQAFKVLPVMVYKVYLDGHEELVRGADLEGTPLTVLSKIVAAGTDWQVFNGVCGAESGWVPVSAASPSLLVSQLEVARREKGQDRPPLLPPPPMAPAAAPATSPRSSPTTNARTAPPKAP